MKVTGNTAPTTNLKVQKYDNENSIIFFYENIESIIPTEDNDATYQWDEYKLIRKSYPNLELDITNNYETWFSAAKEEELRSNPPDLWQMKADLDFLSIMTTI